MKKIKLDVTTLKKTKKPERRLIQAWIPVTLHAKFKKKAKKDSLSLNSVILESIRQYLCE